MAVVSATVTLPIPLFSEVDDIRQLQVFQVFKPAASMPSPHGSLHCRRTAPALMFGGVFSSVLVAANTVFELVRKVVIWAAAMIALNVFC